MTNIPGELGKRIMDTIRQSQKQDKMGREARARGLEQEMLFLVICSMVRDICLTLLKP